MNSTSKAISAFGFLIFISFTAFAQQLSTDKIIKKSLVPQSTSANVLRTTNTPHEKCGFAYELNKSIQKGFNNDEFEKKLGALVRSRVNARTTAIYTVPIIFHIIHRGESVNTVPNISAALVAAQIDQLNKDFANLSGSTYGVAADAGIRFCAAVVDARGRPLAEPGIERIDATTRGWSNTSTMDQATVMNYFDNTIKPASIWDPYSFVNIWTADMNTSGLLGYATFPGLSTLPGLDNGEDDETAGAVIEASSIGSVATPGSGSPYNLGRTVTHELGHFFGLRHIWGDATCGNDYCNDTPPQDDATSGCPATGTLNNCTPSGPKMFQNYMDYSNDACLNTFTADQASRVQTVMLNSLRRKELINSKACQTRAGNAVQFELTQTKQTETGSTGTCPLVKTITLSIGVSVQATGNATLTFTNSGTAVLGRDFTISPASVSFTNGDNSTKTVTITIIDDKAVEAAENIILGYTISGTGVQSGPEKQTLTINIADDDFDRQINSTSTTTILSQDFNSSTNTPSGWVIQNGFTNGWTISANGGGTLTGNAAHITNNFTTRPNSYSKTATSEAYLITPLIDATGLSSVNLSFKWRCRGEIDFDEGYIGYITEADPSTVNLFSVVFSGSSATNTFNGALPASFNNTRFKLVFYWFNDNSAGTDPGFTVDDIAVTAKALTVESTLNDAATAPQYSSQTVQFITPDEQIITRIANLNQDIGCITATIQNAGTGRTTIQTPGGNFFRTNKVVRITPAVSNTTATYQGTLYFTTAELSPTWTGSEIPNLKILKVRDGVNLSGVITSADAQLITPTFTDNSASYGYYAYTGNLTGFSQFMLVSPTFTLPVGLLTFEAQPNKKSIELSWKTAQEKDNKGFNIERSTNGIDFSTIGWVAGVGTSNSTSSYQYSDNFVQPNTMYYYRLKQVDIDNRSSLSNIRQAKIGASGLTVSISPNPVKGQMTVFVSGSLQPADITLINAKGQTVAKWIKAQVSSPYNINTTRFAKGHYTVVISLPDGDITKQIIIQ